MNHLNMVYDVLEDREKLNSTNEVQITDVYIVYTHDFGVNSERLLLYISINSKHHAAADEFITKLVHYDDV